ncbi:hypothetical protein [Alloactinosynnema sp. L-07]|nr:hypothetical protein [Alloactinosynnema sp. L-07]
MPATTTPLGADWVVAQLGRAVWTVSSENRMLDGGVLG